MIFEVVKIDMRSTFVMLYLYDNQSCLWTVVYDTGQ